MINADEHKKLLAQVAELEKNSVNYFDVEKEFFLIDSNNLAEVKTRFYGYSIQATGIYEQDNLTEDAVKNLDGRGCYVYVEARDGKITIKQDLNGCWGIYLFRHGDYFALSNSFFRLLDHVKFKYPLTVNRDYCHYLLLVSYASYSYSETPVNEIELVDRSAILHIDEKKNLEVELIDYREHTLSVDSQDGIAALDRWVELWGKVFRGIAQQTKFIKADLSGGFDTRLSFTLLLHSGVNLNDMQIFSEKSDLHTFAEDYAIASEIAAHWNFKLNQTLPAREAMLYSIDDIFNLNLYSIQTFSLLHRFWGRKFAYKLYGIGGSGGETIRNYWYVSPKELMNKESYRANRYSAGLSRKLLNSIETILKSGFRAAKEKHKVQDPDSPYIPQYLYSETGCRHHFGKGALYAYLANNVVTSSPLIDPEIRTLRLNTGECSDSNLLTAMIFNRYAPDLLKFPFQGQRSIAPETIAYAQKLNELFPCRLSTENNKEIFNLQPRDLQVEKFLAEGKKNNPNLPANFGENCLKAMFESSKTYGLFTQSFDEELYRHAAASYYGKNIFYKSRPMYSIVGITRVLEDVGISKRNHSPYRDMRRFLEQDFCKIPDENAAQIVVDKFKNYFMARADIQLVPKELGDLKIVSVSDDKADVSNPDWFNKVGGIGYVITSYVGKLEFVAKATVDGEITLKLRGMDIHETDYKSKRLPYWIDYTKLTVNGKVIFDKLTPAWHDNSYVYNMNVKANDEIKIQVEWLPHRSDV